MARNTTESKRRRSIVKGLLKKKGLRVTPSGKVVKIKKKPKGFFEDFFS